MFTFLRVLAILLCATFMTLSVDAILHDRGTLSMHVFNIIVQALVGTYNAYCIFADRSELSFSVRLYLAKTVIAQVKAGEWIPEENQFQSQTYNILRNGQKMWVANGAWFLQVDNVNIFGDILKHYVWHKAVKQIVNEADKKYKDIDKITTVAKKVLGEKPTLTIVK
jgi:hypothetical protein